MAVIFSTQSGGENFGGYDAFLAKFTGTGSLVYSSYFGADLTDRGERIAVDASGDVYISGYTSSTFFPTLSAYQSLNAGSSDVTISKLS